MLTEQNVIMELTDSSDTVPIGFITMDDDGHTLLAVGGKTIELIIIYKNNISIITRSEIQSCMYIILQLQYMFYSLHIHNN